MACAASTNRFCFADSTAPRTTRELPGMMTMAMASIALVVLGRSTDTMARARMSPGIVISASMIRCRMRSRRPSQYPDTSPTTIPTDVPMPTASSPTQSEMRLPKITRLSTSRPMSSVPKGWAQLGGASRISGCAARGSYGARTLAKIAVKTRMRIRPAEIIPSGFRFITVHRERIRLICSVTGWSKLRAGAVAMAMAQLTPSLIADPRIQPGVGQIHDQVERHQGHGHRHHVRLHDRIVTEEDRLHRQPAHAGEREDGLHDDGAREQRPELPTYQRDHRDERVLQRVLVDDDALAQALGPRRAHVVLAQHLEERGARHAHGGGGEPEPEHGGGEEELLEIRPRIVPEARVPEGRDPAEPDRREGDDERAEPEVGEGQPGDGSHPTRVVRGLVLPGGRDDADGNGDDQPEDQREHRELDRDRNGLLESHRDRLVGEDGITGAQAHHLP